MTHTWPSSQIPLQEKHAVVLYKFTKLGEQYTISNTIKHIGVDELIPQGKTFSVMNNLCSYHSHEGN